MPRAAASAAARPRARRAPVKRAPARRVYASRRPLYRSIARRRAADMSAASKESPYTFGGIGSAVGRAAGNLLGKITGLGDYKYQRNSLLGEPLTADAVPVMHSAKDGVRIRHREYLQDVSSTVAFSNTSYAIQPGITSSFPFLSALAQNFEQYRVEGMIYEFVSTSADALNSTNTALGTVIMAAEYNAAAPAYVNKQQMENSMWAVSTKPSCSMLMPVECAPQLNTLSNLYVRTLGSTTSQPINFTDLGTFQIATVGSQAAAVIGELWVSYDIVLLKPQVSSGLALTAKTSHLQLNSISNSVPLGTSATSKFDTIGVSTSGTVVTIPAGNQGNYFFQYCVKGNSTALTGPAVNLGSNANGLTILLNDQNDFLDNSGQTATFYFCNLYFTIVNPALPTTITFGTSGVLPASVVSGDILLTQLNGNLNS